MKRVNAPGALEVSFENDNYDPTTAQFISNDPKAAATRSPYGYVGNSPLNGTDPSGELCMFGHHFSFLTNGCSDEEKENRKRSQEKLVDAENKVLEWEYEQMGGDPFHAKVGLEILKDLNDTYNCISEVQEGEEGAQKCLEDLVSIITAAPGCSGVSVDLINVDLTR